jgi:hypothetical protein
VSAPDLLPGGRQRLDPDPYRGSVAGWLASAAVLVTFLALVATCEPARTDRTPTDAPAPAPTEGDAGGTWGWDR